MIQIRDIFDLSSVLFVTVRRVWSTSSREPFTGEPVGLSPKS